MKSQINIESFNHKINFSREVLEEFVATFIK
jgi:hypothetical protein